VTDTEFSYQAGLAASAVYLIQWLKGANWFPWLSEHTELANRVVASVLAVMSALGIQWTVEGNMNTGGTLTVTLPAISAIINAAIHIVTQLALQQSFYKVSKLDTK
jgi:prenyltransferase beta subunit